MIALRVAVVVPSNFISPGEVVGFRKVCLPAGARGRMPATVDTLTLYFRQGSLRGTSDRENARSLSNARNCSHRSPDNGKRLGQRQNHGRHRQRPTGQG